MADAYGFVAGGGWKNSRGHLVKWKACCCLALTVVLFGLVIFELVSGWILIPATVLLVACVVLFWWEAPVRFPGFPDGSHDPHNLYGCSNVVRGEVDDHRKY